MASKQRKVKKTRSSRLFCEEKLSCSEDKAVAVLECVECGSKQCEACDDSIHSRKANKYHERKEITIQQKETLCAYQCKDINYADIVCIDCGNFLLCFACFEKSHPLNSLKRSNHKQETLKAYLAKEMAAKKEAETLAKLKAKETAQKSLAQLSDESFTSCLLSLNEENQKPPAGVENMQNSCSLPDIMANVSFNDENRFKSFHLLDKDEACQVKDVEDFTNKLGCNKDNLLKVISIFGNTGDGKSHTLNETLFNGKSVFETSKDQASCTAGAWAALDDQRKALVIDTEGLLGISTKAAERTRLLLKILAISDIVIYRTRAERLRDEMYHFLNDAAKSYREYFKKELMEAHKRCKFEKSWTDLGPVVIIFQETQHTNVLGHGKGKKPETLIREDLKHLQLSIEGFNAVHYAGTQTQKAPTNFRPLREKVEQLLRDNTVRSARTPVVIFTALKVLNDKFTGKIEFSPESFPDQYFTCGQKCLSCNTRCRRAVNHSSGKHECEPNVKCKYQHHLENKVYLCKACLNQGQEVVVVPKPFSSKDNSWLGLANYMWSGYVLECRTCGIIFRSRQHWYGNEDPDKSVVRTEVHHVWPGESVGLQGSHNAARRLVEGLNYVSDSIANVSAKPAMAVRLWVTDKIAPPYWRPNSMITECKACGDPFSEQLTIHHCRRCGEGFCDTCSAQRVPVPERGWGPEHVRVCDACAEKQASFVDESNISPREVRPRQMGEVIGSTVGAVASVVSYPIGIIKDSSRPSYWVPDEDIQGCLVCKKEFGVKLRLHHCRGCGHGVCGPCSTNQREVPSRGWDEPVRVCDTCDKKEGIL